MCISGCTPSNPRIKGPGPVDCAVSSCPAKRDFLIAVGDPGLGEHNQGRSFDNAAATHEQEIQKGTFPGVPSFVKDQDRVVTRRISTVTALASFIKEFENIVYLSYFGHSWGRDEGHGVLLIGEQADPDTNLSHSPGSTYTPPTVLEAFHFRSDGQVRLFGCRGGYGPDSIARQLADQLRIPVYAYTNSGGSLFTTDSNLGRGLRKVTQADIDAKIPSKGKLWLVPINGKPTFQKF